MKTTIIVTSIAAALVPPAAQAQLVVAAPGVEARQDQKHLRCAQIRMGADAMGGQARHASQHADHGAAALGNGQSGQAGHRRSRRRHRADRQRPVLRILAGFRHRRDARRTHRHHAGGRGAFRDGARVVQPDRHVRLEKSLRRYDGQLRRHGVVPGFQRPAQAVPRGGECLFAL